MIVAGTRPEAIKMAPVFRALQKTKMSTVLFSTGQHGEMLQHGIDRYPFGLDGLVAIKVKSRSSATQEPQVEITSDVPLELTVLWGDKQKTANVKPGTQTV